MMLGSKTANLPQKDSLKARIRKIWSKAVDVFTPAQGKEDDTEHLCICQRAMSSSSANGRANQGSKAALCGAPKILLPGDKHNFRSQVVGSHQYHHRRCHLSHRGPHHHSMKNSNEGCQCICKKILKSTWLWKITLFLMGKSTMFMTIFNSKLLVTQRVPKLWGNQLRIAWGFSPRLFLWGGAPLVMCVGLKKHKVVPPQWCERWFINHSNYRYNPLINPSYWTYLHWAPPWHYLWIYSP